MNVTISQGNLPVVTGQLTGLGGAPVNLAGCTVAFAMQGTVPPSDGWVHPASITTEASGQVSYQFAAGETAVAGRYQAQWRVTDGGGAVTLYPGGECGVIEIVIREALPQANPATITLVRQMRELVRVALGDLSKIPQYRDEAIDAVIRTCLRIGKVPGQALSPNQSNITPGLTQPRDIALLMLNAAKMFVLPNSADYRYETRAISERFGRQDFFVRELENQLYELENGEMFSCTQSFYAWVNSVVGIDIWGMMSDMHVNAPVATVSLGRAGITVATT